MPWASKKFRQIDHPESSCRRGVPKVHSAVTQTASIPVPDVFKLQQASRQRMWRCSKNKSASLITLCSFPLPELHFQTSHAWMGKCELSNSWRTTLKLTLELRFPAFMFCIVVTHQLTSVTIFLENHHFSEVLYCWRIGNYD